MTAQERGSVPPPRRSTSRSTRCRAARRPDGWLVVHVDGSVPSERDDGGSPWQGMSGAALLRGDVVVGLIAGDPPRSGRPPPRDAGHRAGADHASRRSRRPSWSTSSCSASSTRRAPPRRGRGHRAGAAARPRAEVVAFRGRESELATLQAWCEAEPRLGVALIRGPGGIGKTRLAAELATACGAGAVAGLNSRRGARVGRRRGRDADAGRRRRGPPCRPPGRGGPGRGAAGGRRPVRVVRWRATPRTGGGTRSPTPWRRPPRRRRCRAARGRPRPGRHRRGRPPAAFFEAARDLRAPGAQRRGPRPRGARPVRSGVDAILYIQLAAGRAIAGDGDGGEGAEDLLAWRSPAGALLARDGQGERPAAGRRSRGWRGRRGDARGGRYRTPPPRRSPRFPTWPRAPATGVPSPAGCATSIPSRATAGRRGYAGRSSATRWCARAGESPGTRTPSTTRPSSRPRGSARPRPRRPRDDAVEQLLEAIVSERLRALWWRPPWPGSGWRARPDGPRARALGRPRPRRRGTGGRAAQHGGPARSRRDRLSARGATALEEAQKDPAATEAVRPR